MANSGDARLRRETSVIRLSAANQTQLPVMTLLTHAIIKSVMRSILSVTRRNIPSASAEATKSCKVVTSSMFFYTGSYYVTGTASNGSKNKLNSLTVCT